MRKMPLFQQFICLVTIVFALLNQGCEPEKTKLQKRLAKVEQVSFPVDARAEIILPLELVSKKIVIRTAYFIVVLQDGKALSDIAKETFSEMFKEADSRGKVENPHYSIMLKSDTTVDYFWGVYKTDVECTIAYGDGTNIGNYKAQGDEGGLLSGQEGIEKAYRKAFKKIVDQILEDSQAMRILAGEADEQKIRIAERTQEIESDYEEFIKSVVTIEVKGDESQNAWVYPKKHIDGHGSGYFINDKGLILTNTHVVKDAEKITVKHKETEYKGKVLALDEWNDLALVKIDAEGTSPLELISDTSSYSIGDEVIAVGSPMTKDLEHTISKGIISSIRDYEGYKMIQTDAAINPGSSGGPLIKVSDRKVIGVVTMMAYGEGLGFAIPVETVRNFLAKNSALY